MLLPICWIYERRLIQYVGQDKCSFASELPLNIAEDEKDVLGRYHVNMFVHTALNLRTEHRLQVVKMCKLVYLFLDAIGEEEIFLESVIYAGSLNNPEENTFPYSHYPQPDTKASSSLVDVSENTAESGRKDTSKIAGQFR